VKKKIQASAEIIMEELKESRYDLHSNGEEEVIITIATVMTT
jgi:hypothetical protein